MQHKYIASYPAQFGGHKGSLMIVHLQPVFIHPKRYQKWSDHEKIASRPILMWGTVHFQSVGRGGGVISIILGYYKGGPPPKDFMMIMGHHILQIPPAPFPPPPPHKKWTVSEWSKSRVNGCWNVWKNSLKTQERVPNYKSVGKAATFLSFLSPPFPSPWPNVEQNLIYICA